MSLEFWATLASVGTFVVIAATAIAALIQLRHMRGTNQIATMARFETMEAEPEVRDSTRFILLELTDRMKDPGFRKLFEKGALQGEARRILPAAQLYEQMGNYVHHGFIDADFVLDQYAGTIIGLWDRMTPAMPYIRAAQGEEVFIWFEYLTVLAQRYTVSGRGLNYPANMPRLPLDVTYFERDRPTLSADAD